MTAPGTHRAAQLYACTSIPSPCRRDRKARRTPARVFLSSMLSRSGEGIFGEGEAQGPPPLQRPLFSVTLVPHAGLAGRGHPGMSLPTEVDGGFPAPGSATRPCRAMAQPRGWRPAARVFMSSYAGGRCRM